MQAIEEYVETEFKHYGVGHNGNPPGRGSGKLPYGSGQRPYQDIEGTSKYNKLMKNKDSSSGSSREAYVKKSKQSLDKTAPDSAKKAYRNQHHTGQGDKSSRNEEYQRHKDYKSDSVKQLEERVKQLESEKAALEKKSEKKGIKKLFSKKDKEDDKIQKKTRKELMDMSSDEIHEYMNKLRNVDTALNMQSPARKFITQQGGELAKAVAKDVAVPVMTRFIKQGIYQALKTSNDKRAENQRLSDEDLRYMAFGGEGKNKKNKNRRDQDPQNDNQQGGSQSGNQGGNQQGGSNTSSQGGSQGRNQGGNQQGGRLNTGFQNWRQQRQGRNQQSGNNTGSQSGNQGGNQQGGSNTRSQSTSSTSSQNGSRTRSLNESQEHWRQFFAQHSGNRRGGG